MYSAVEHLARTLYLGRFHWKIRMAMFSAYFDESGHPDMGDYLVVSGCVADVEQWKHLEREWIAVLDPLNTRIFHRVDFEKENPPFDDFPGEAKKNELLSQLLSIVVRRIEKSFSVAIPLAQYNAINKDHLFAEWNGYPYPLAARLCMGYVTEWAEYHAITDPIEFVFEDDAKHRGQLSWLAEKDKLPLPIFKKKSECVPLQPADLIAWEHHRMLTDAIRTTRRKYSATFEQLEKASNQWEILKLDDPERVIMRSDTPRRDPNLRYQCKIIRHAGRRRALVYCWPRSSKQQPKKRLIVPD